MLNQVLKYVFLVSFTPFVLFAELLPPGFSSRASPTKTITNVNEPNSVFKATAPTLEAKAGYFFFLNSKMREVYYKGGIDAQITGTYPIWRGLQFYGSIEFLERSGKSLGDKQKTTLYQIPINLGLRPVFTFCKQVQYYLTFGPRYFYVHQHNDSSYIPENKGRNGLGFFANTGFNFIPIEHFVIDIFGEYSWAKTHFHNVKNKAYGRDLQIGGLTFGGGLGYCF